MEITPSYVQSGTGSDAPKALLQSVGDEIVYNEVLERAAEVKESEVEESKVEEGGAEESEIDRGEAGDSEAEGGDHFEDCE